MNQLKKHFSELSDHHGFYARNEIGKFNFNWFARSWKLSTENLLEEIQPVITEKDEIDTNNKTNNNFLEFSDSLESDAWMKNNDFYKKCYSKNEKIPTRLLW